MESPSKKPEPQVRPTIYRKKQIVLKTISVVTIIGFFVQSSLVLGWSGVWVGITGVLIGYFFGVVDSCD